MAIDTWLLYTAAVIVLAITPGPNSLLVLTHGVAYGPGRTLFTIAGGVVGFSALIALAMFGLGALLQTSSDALWALKWVGGMYLVWLGIGLWRNPGLKMASVHQTQIKNTSLLRQGLLCALSNPKVLLFYGAFLPQFIHPEHGLLTQFVVMAATFATIEALVEYAIARFAYRLRPWLERAEQGFNRCCGGLFIGIGVSLPLSR
jgi:threonine/homoserine/homoserine lactone efflux protein